MFSISVKCPEEGGETINYSGLQDYVCVFEFINSVILLAKFIKSFRIKISKYKYIYRKEKSSQVKSTELIFLLL